jgi:hypothetical protein
MKKGYLDRDHYNFSGLEKHHYYSRILKFPITILLLPNICHFIGLPSDGACCQSVFVHTYFVLFSLHSLTCGGPTHQLFLQPPAKNGGNCDTSETTAPCFASSSAVQPAGEEEFGGRVGYKGEEFGEGRHG